MIPRFVLFGLPEAIERNFKLLDLFFKSEDLFKFDWRFINFEVSSAVTSYAIPHNLGYVPTDLIKTRDEGNITFHYDLFTDKFIYITTTGATKFRGMLGRYRENKQ